MFAKFSVFQCIVLLTVLSVFADAEDSSEDVDRVDRTFTNIGLTLGKREANDKSVKFGIISTWPNIIGDTTVTRTYTDSTKIITCIVAIPFNFIQPKLTAGDIGQNTATLEFTGPNIVPFLRGSYEIFAKNA